ncbi:MAG TPA: hypothetical protein PLK94_00045 [Alphaproteobacteria bacterium]|nr:hypothetical protein [Alphaproteobacteria bacterium]
MKIIKSKRNTASAISTATIILMSLFCASCSSTLSFRGLGNSVDAANTNSSRTAVYDRSLGGEEIDWNNGIVVASGRSAVSNTGNASQDIIVAEKAARTLAYERLAEIISGINIDSQRTITMEMLTDSILSGRVSAFIKGARVISSDYKTYPDGSGYVEVVLSVNMNGEGGLRDIASDAVKRPLPGLPQEIYIPSESAITTPTETPREHSDTYVDIQRTSPNETNGEAVAELIGTTGLIVDASGFGVKRAMSPKILAPDERVIYGLLIVDESYVIQQGIVSYAHSIAEAKSRQRAGLNPLVVRATGVSGIIEADVIVSEEDAERIVAENRSYGFLEKCNVIIVVD